MSRFTYEIIRPAVESSNKLEKRIENYTREKGVRMARARRQLIEKGLAEVEMRLPERTKEGERTFREKIKNTHHSRRFRTI